MVDLADKKLIMELFNDGRATIAGISKKIHISREKCLYRINRLKESGILKKVVPVVNYSLTGNSLYRVQLKLDASKNQNELIEELKQLKNIAWLVKLHGNWDLVFSVWAENVEEFQITYERILEKYGAVITGRLFTVVTGIEHYSPDYLLKSRRKCYETNRAGGKSIVLEESQKTILKHLFEDGRMPLFEIASRMGVSITTVKYHLKKLRDEKVLLGFRPVIDIAKLGFQHFKVMLELLDYSEKLKCRELLKSCVNVVYITHSIGSYDIEFEAEFESLKSLLDFMELVKPVIKIKNYELVFTNEELVFQEVPFG